MGCGVLETGPCHGATIIVRAVSRRTRFVDFGSAQTDPQLGGGGSTSSLQSLGKAIGLLKIKTL